MLAESTVSGVLLAAGASRRFGADLPKQLWPVAGEALVRRVARRALGSRLSEVIVVVGHQADRVTAALAGLPVRIVENAAHSSGQASSVRAGLEAVSGAASGSLFLPVDQPHLDSRLIDGLIELLNSIEQTTIDSFYQALTDALVDINGSNQFADDLTLFLLRQQPTSKKLLPRTADGARKLVMRWMKRKAPRCNTPLPAFPQTANL